MSTSDSHCIVIRIRTTGISADSLNVFLWGSFVFGVVLRVVLYLSLYIYICMYIYIYVMYTHMHVYRHVSCHCCYELFGTSVSLTRAQGLRCVFSRQDRLPGPSHVAHLLGRFIVVCQASTQPTRRHSGGFKYGSRLQPPPNRQFIQEVC